MQLDLATHPPLAAAPAAPPSLVEQAPEVWARIAKVAPAMAEMAQHFADPHVMSRALNYTEGAVYNWVRERSQVSRGSERRAQAWLDARAATHAAPAPAPAPAELHLVVTGPPPAIAKAEKVLAILGCTFVPL